MAKIKDPVYLTAPGTAVAVHPNALKDFPEASAFFAALLARGSLSQLTASHYVKLVARLKRSGRLNSPDRITLVTERTAANAYHRWIAENYWERARLVHDAFVPLGKDLLKAITWLRCSSLAAPVLGKTLPMPVNPMTRVREWVPCDRWTLHVPAKEVPVHTDPCEECDIIVLTDEQLAVIVHAFELAWGSRDLFWSLPRETLLFGTPPIGNYSPDREVSAKACIVALSEPTIGTEALNKANAAVTRKVDSFVVALRDGADAVYLSRAACGEDLEYVLGVIGETWR